MARMILCRLCLIVTAVAFTACAQVTAAAEPPLTPESAVAALPEALMGKFSPYSRNYQRFGDLILTKDVLSWGHCQQLRYRVFRERQGAYYLEQEATPACKFANRSSYLVLVPTTEGLEVSICPERDEFDKPDDARLCSWGVLYKQKPEPAS